MADDTTFGIDPSDEYGNAQGKIAAEKLRKQQRLTDLLQNHLGKSETISPTQAFAASALALLPVIVGKHYAGTKGAALGAQAGSVGAGGYLSGLGQEANDRKKVALYEANQTQDEINSLRNQDSQLERARLYKQGQEELQQDRFNKQVILNQQKRSQTNAPSPQDPLVTSWLTKKMNGQPTTPEEDTAAAQNPKIVSTGATAAKAFGPKEPPSEKPFGVMGVELSNKVLKNGSIAEWAIDIADQVEKSGVSWKQLQAGALVSGLDVQFIQQRISNLANAKLRNDSGAAAPEPEKQAMRKMVVGDFSVEPKYLAEMLRVFAQDQAADANRLMTSAKDPAAFQARLQQIANGIYKPSSEGKSDRTPDEEAFFQQKKAEALARRQNG